MSRETLDAWMKWVKEGSTEDLEEHLRHALKAGAKRDRKNMPTPRTLTVRENPNENQNENQLGFHPAYGLSDETRLQILRDADTSSVRMAAYKHNVSATSIYNWRKGLRRSGGAKE